MKRFVLALMACAVLISCQEAPRDFLELTNMFDNSYTIPGEGGSITVSFSSSGSWSAKGDASWVTVSPSQGEAGYNDITITAAANSDIEASRNSEVVIRSGQLQATVYITQGEGSGFILTKNEFEIGKDGGELSIPVKSNITDFTCNVDESCKDWISVATDQPYWPRKIVLLIEQNMHGEAREGLVYICHKDHKETVRIKQSEGDELIVTTKTFEIGSLGGQIKVPVATNKDLQVSVLSNGNGWIKAESIQTKTMQDYYVVLSVEPNDWYDERIGQIKIQSGSKEGPMFVADGNVSIITVTQSQKEELIVNTTPLEIGSNGGTVTYLVESNVDYSCEVMGGCSWISVTSSNTKALKTSYVYVTIDKNNTYDARVGQVKFSGAGKESIVTITQSQYDEILVTNNAFEIDQNGGEIKIPIESNVQYEAKLAKSYNWIRLEQMATKSLESTIVTLHVDANDTYDERIAELTISYPKNSTITRHITITQAQRDEILVSQDQYEVDRIETILAIDVKSNTELNVNVSCDWIVPVNTKALQTSIYNFNVLENLTGKERTGEITFSSKDNKLMKKVMVKQLLSRSYKGDYNISSKDDILFLRDGGYNRIDGNLSIRNITNVSDLDNAIEEISGDLIAYNISNFDGLYGLKAIGGTLDIDITSNYNSLFSFEGLNNLESIGGSFDCDCWAEHAFADSNLEKLNKLKTIGGYLSFSIVKSTYNYNTRDRLSSLKGLENLSSIGSGIYLMNVPSLEGLSGIKELKTLYITDAYNLDGLKNLTRVDGSVTIRNGYFDSFSGLCNLEYIGGNLTIEATAHLYSSFEFPVDDLFPNITSLAGFDSLREIGGDFEISAFANPCYGHTMYRFKNLKSLDGLKSLQRIGGNMTIQSEIRPEDYVYGYYTERKWNAYCLNNLSSINIGTLQEIGGTLLVDDYLSDSYYQNKRYTLNISDFSFTSLKTIGGNITSHYKVKSGHEEEGYGRISKAPGKLESVGNINAICSFDSESDGFTSLMRAGNIYGDGTGFPALKNISGSLEITGDDITRIGSMPSLESISNDLLITDTKISQIQAFNKLSSVGKISITGNHVLKTINGFTNLSRTNITISGSPSLYDFGAFVNAVKNGSSWTVTGCGYNPTKYQMQNGQSKP